MRLLVLLLLAGCAQPPTLTVGQQAEGALTDGDEPIHAGAVVDVVRVRLEAGEAAAVIVTSMEVAPFVIVAAGAAPWGSATGVAAGQGACIAVDATEALDLQVYVSSAGGAGFGAYRVAVAPFTHALAARHGCRLGGPAGHPPVREPTFTAGSRRVGDHRRPSAV